MKVISIDAKKYTPKDLLSEALEHAEDMKNVIVIGTLKDGTIFTRWSDSFHAERCQLLLALQAELIDQMNCPCD